MLRVDPRVRFRGRIHETMLPDVRARVDAGDGHVAELRGVALRHLGYDGDMTPRYRRNLPLLREAVRDDPLRAFLWTDLARAAWGLGLRDEARAVWARLCDPACAVPEDGAGGLAAGRSDYWREHLEAHPEPLGLLRAHLDAAPWCEQLRWFLARAQYRAGDWRAAREGFLGLRARAGAGGHDRTMAYDQRLFTSFAAEALGMCAWRAGAAREAARWLAQAAEEEPEAPRRLRLHARAAVMRGT